MRKTITIVNEDKFEGKNWVRQEDIYDGYLESLAKIMPN
jgi:hypothetical protein